jgi:hypothetical protein
MINRVKHVVPTTYICSGTRMCNIFVDFKLEIIFSSKKEVIHHILGHENFLGW